MTTVSRAVARPSPVALRSRRARTCSPDAPRTARAAVGALAVTLGLGLAACGGTGSTGTAASPGSTGTASSPGSPVPTGPSTTAGSGGPSGASPSTGKGTTTAPFTGVVVAVRVAGGTVVPPTHRVDVPMGQRVRLQVDSDVADEVHVHGYDLKQDVAPGSPATVELVADQPGLFEVELEEARLQLVQLEVR